MNKTPFDAIFDAFGDLGVDQFETFDDVVGWVVSAIVKHQGASEFFNSPEYAEVKAEIDRVVKEADAQDRAIIAEPHGLGFRVKMAGRSLKLPTEMDVRSTASALGMRITWADTRPAVEDCISDAVQRLNVPLNADTAPAIAEMAVDLPDELRAGITRHLIENAGWNPEPSVFAFGMLLGLAEKDGDLKDDISAILSRAEEMGIEYIDGLLGGIGYTTFFVIKSIGEALEDYVMLVDVPPELKQLSKLKARVEKKVNRDELRDAIEAAATTSGDWAGIEISDGKGRYAVFLPDATEKGRVRLSFFDSNGFESHITRDTYDQLFSELKFYSFDRLAPGTLDELSLTESFIRGNAATTAAASLQAANQKVPQAWTVDSSTWIDAKIRASEYAEEYLNNRDYYEEQAAQLLVEWESALEKRAAVGRISDRALDDIVRRDGEYGLVRFRGVLEAGVDGYLPPAVTSAGGPAITAKTPEVELVDEHDPAERIGASVAGESTDRALLILLADMLETATDVMNGEEFPPAAINSAVELLERIEGVIKSESDTAPVLIDAAERIDEWLGSEDFGPDANAFRAVQAKIAELITPDVVENSRADEIQKAPDAERDAIKTAEANEAVTPIDDAGKNAPDQIEEAKKSAFYRNNVFASVIEPARQAVPFHQTLEEMKTALENVTSIYDKQTGGLTDHGKHLVNALRQAEKEHVNPFDIVTLPPELNGYRQVMEDTAPSAKAEYERAFDMLHADFVAETIRTINAEKKVSSMTADKELRAQVMDAYRSLDVKTEWFPAEITLNNQTAKVLVSLGKIPTGAQQLRGIDIPIYILQLKAGRPMAGLPLEIISNVYKLSGRNELSLNSTRSATPSDIAGFISAGIGLPADLASVLKADRVNQTEFELRLNGRYLAGEAKIDQRLETTSTSVLGLLAASGVDAADVKEAAIDFRPGDDLWNAQTGPALLSCLMDAVRNDSEIVTVTTKNLSNDDLAIYAAAGFRSPDEFNETLFATVSDALENQLEGSVVPQKPAKANLGIQLGDTPTIRRNTVESDGEHTHYRYQLIVPGGSFPHNVAGGADVTLNAPKAGTGTIDLFAESDDAAPATAAIDFFDINEKYQGAGYGTRLLNYIEQDCAANGADTVLLRTSTAGIEKWFEDRGYVGTGMVPRQKAVSAGSVMDRVCADLIDWSDIPEKKPTSSGLVATMYRESRVLLELTELEKLFLGKLSEAAKSAGQSGLLQAAEAGAMIRTLRGKKASINPVKLTAYAALLLPDMATMPEDKATPKIKADYAWRMLIDTAGLSDAPEHKNATGVKLDENMVYPRPEGPATEVADLPDDIVELNIPVETLGEYLNEFEHLMENAEEREHAGTMRNKDESSPEFMTPEAAASIVASWKSHAKEQGLNPAIRSRNSDKWVISLFDYTGEWAKPWADAGYNVLTVDLQDGIDVNDFSVEYLVELLDDNGIDINSVYMMLIATPCTDFANCGAKHFWIKDLDGRTEASKKLVFQSLKTVEFIRPKAGWAIENPAGRIERLTGLPKARYSFHPHHFGADYTKETVLWGRFETDLPTANTFPVAGSKMHTQYGGSSIETKNARSATPEGFAYAFFMANNYEDLTPAQRLKMDFKQVSGAVLAADAAGIPESTIRVLAGVGYGDEDYDLSRTVIAKAVHCINEGISVDDLVYGIDRAAGSFNDVTAIINAVDDLVESTGYAPAQDDVQPPSDEELYAELTEGDNKTGIFTPDSAPWADRNLLATNDWYGSIVNLTMTSGEQITGGFIEEARGSMMRVSTIEDPAGRVILPNDVATMELVSLSHFPDAGQKLLNKGKTWVRKGSAEQKLKAWGLEGSYYVEGNGNPDRAWWLQKMPDIHRSQFAELEDVLYVGEQLGTKVAFYLNDQDGFSVDMVRKAIKHYDYLALRRVEGREINSKEWAVLVSPEEQHLLDALFAKAERPAEMKLSREVQIRAAVNKVIQAGSPSDEIPVTVKTGSDVENVVVRLGRRPSAARQFEGYQVPLEVNWLAINGKGERVAFEQKINGKNAITDPASHPAEDSWLVAAYESAGFKVPGSQQDEVEILTASNDIKADSEFEKAEFSLAATNVGGTGKIDDTGYIAGAAKERWATFRKAFEEQNPDFENTSFSKIFPIPDYPGLIADGYSKVHLSLVAALRAEASSSSKPRMATRRKMDRWVAQQESIFSMARSILFEPGFYERTVALIHEKQDENLLKFYQKSKLLARLPDGAINTASKVIDIRNTYVRDYSAPDERRIDYQIHGKKKFLGIEWYRDMDEVQQSKINEIIEHVDVIQAANKNRVKSEIKIEIYRWPNGDFFAAYNPTKANKTAVKLERVPEEFQGDWSSAREWLAQGDNVERLRERVEKTRAYKMRHDENADREGDHDWRSGMNISQHDLKTEFGLRDIQFGNSTLASQKEAQERLNHAYDALCDLAEVLGVDRKAIGLNGSLALAFGARGRGGSGKSGGTTLAHYEPGEIVINLTRVNGAGSLAHEFFHALDNYFRKLGLLGEDSLMAANYSYATEAALSDKRKSDPSYGLRQEVKDAFFAIYDSIHSPALYEASEELDAMFGRKERYWSSTVELAARSFEAYVKEKLAEKGIRNDFLVNLNNDLDPNDPERLGGVVPTAYGLHQMGIYDAFEDLFKVVQQRETEAGMLLFRKEDPDFTAAAYAWAAAVSEDDYLFRFGIDVGGTIPKIFEASGFDVTDDRTLLNIMKQVLPQDYGSRLSVAWLIGTPQQDPVYIYETDSEVWLDVSSLTSGVGGGAEIYQMAAGYALGAGKTLIGDPEGLTSLAVVRFTESMVSSALRFGTTKHIRPSIEQMTGKDANGNAVPGVMPLDWSEDDYSNIASLLKVSYNNVLAHLPEIQYVSYDIEQSKFRDDRSAAATGSNTDRLVDYLNGEAGTSGLGSEDVFWRSLSPVARALAGSATLKRAIVTQTLLRAAGQENLRQNFSGYVRQLFSENSVNPLTGILYRNDDAGYSSARVSIVENWIKPVEEATGVPVRVVATAADLPPRIADQLKSSVTGVYDWATGTPYIIADQVRGESHAVKTALHEGLGHTGVIEFMRRNSERGGAEMETLLDTIFRDLGAAEIRRVVPASYSFDYSVAKDRREAVLEYIAHLAETGEKPKLVNDLAVAGRDFVEGLFGDQKWTRNDILALIETSRAYVLAEQCVKAGAGMGVSPEERARRREEAFNKVLADAGGRLSDMLRANTGDIAWHGSDAFIRTFDHSQIGSGVGQQLSGFGHYLTTSKKRAEEYAEYRAGDRGNLHQVLLPLSDTDFLRLDQPVYQQPEVVINGLASAGLYDQRLDSLYRQYAIALERAAESGDEARMKAAAGLNPGLAAKAAYQTGLITGADLYARLVENLTYDGNAWGLLPANAYDKALSVQHAASMLLNKAGIPGAVITAGNEKVFVVYDETLTPVISINGERLAPASAEEFLMAIAEGKAVKLEESADLSHTKAFSEWFGKSKIVDSDGSPAIVYHGTESNFDAFKLSEEGNLGSGIYFFNHRESAEIFGDNVIEVYLSVQNPWRVNVDWDADLIDLEDFDSPSIEAILSLPGGREILDETKAGTGLYGDNVKNIVESLGYDGIIACHPDGIEEIVVFYPSQIKSATENNGDFDYYNDSFLAKSDQDLPVFSDPFMDWFGGSKVVTSAGMPMVMYHGTGSDFENFDHNNTGGVGFYFTADPVVASEHAAFGNYPSIIPVYLSVKNPAPDDVVKREYAKARGGNPRKVAHEALKAKGYDGIIRKGETVVFSPEQIKSAIGNAGAFSPTSSSILEKREADSSCLNVLNPYLTAQTIQDLTWLSADELVGRDGIVKSSSRKSQPATTLPLGSVSVDKVLPASEGYVRILAEIQVAESELHLNEVEQPADQNLFRKYVTWAEEGVEAPAITVNQSFNTGKLISVNRRRVLAAREAGVPTIKAWVSLVNPNTGDPLKIVDLKGDIAALQLAAKQQVHTEAFKAWFANSKAVQSNGEPLTLYRGAMNSEEIIKAYDSFGGALFGRGIYLTDDPVDASRYTSTDPMVNSDFTDKAASLAIQMMAAEGRVNEGIDPKAYAEAKRILAGTGGSVTPLYVALQNPLVIRQEPVSCSQEVFRLALAESVDTSTYSDEFIENKYRLFSNAKSAMEQYKLLRNNNLTKVFRSIASLLNHDGIIVGKEVMYGGQGNADHYIVFNSAQVKSAIGNNGEYSPFELSILKKQSPEIQSGKAISRRVEATFVDAPAEVRAAYRTADGQALPDFVADILNRGSEAVREYVGSNIVGIAREWRIAQLMASAGDNDQSVRYYQKGVSQPAGNPELDMATEARLSRAEIMGFNTDIVFYPKESGSTGYPVFTGQATEEIIHRQDSQPSFLNIGNAYQALSPEAVEKAARDDRFRSELAQQGYDSVVWADTDDLSRGPGLWNEPSQVVVFSPRQVQSINSPFNGAAKWLSSGFAIENSMRANEEGYQTDRTWYMQGGRGLDRIQPLPAIGRFGEGFYLSTSIAETAWPDADQRQTDNTMFARAVAAALGGDLATSQSLLDESKVTLPVWCQKECSVLELSSKGLCLDGENIKLGYLMTQSLRIAGADRPGEVAAAISAVKTGTETTACEIMQILIDAGCESALSELAVTLGADAVEMKDGALPGTAVENTHRFVVAGNAIVRSAAVERGSNRTARYLAKLEKQCQIDPVFQHKFGNSVVRDAFGAPRVVYRGQHGAYDGNTIQTKSASISFGQSDTASHYAMYPNVYADVVNAPRVIPAYLSIERPFIKNLDDPFVSVGDIVEKLGTETALGNAAAIAERFSAYIYNTDNWHEVMDNYGVASIEDLAEEAPEAIGGLYFDIYPLLDDHKAVDAMRRAGFDGAIHIGNGESAGELEYRVFDESQVISALEYPSVKDFRRHPEIKYQEALVRALEGRFEGYVETTADSVKIAGQNGMIIEFAVATEKFRTDLMPAYGSEGLTLNVIDVRRVEGPKYVVGYMNAAARALKESGLVDVIAAGRSTESILDDVGFIRDDAGNRFLSVSDAAQGLQRATVRFLFAGKKANGADLTALEVAQKLARENRSEEKIWKETGWYQGADKEWRFEIDDSTSTLTDFGKNLIEDSKNGSVQGVGFRTTISMGDILDHNELYLVYPGMRLMPVKIASEIQEGYAGAINTRKDGLVEIEVRVNRWSTEDDVLSVLIHEVQHIIQRSEGFGLGGNTAKDMADRMMYNISDRIKEKADKPEYRDYCAATQKYSRLSLMQRYIRFRDLSMNDNITRMARQVYGSTEYGMHYRDLVDTLGVPPSRRKLQQHKEWLQGACVIISQKLKEEFRENYYTDIKESIQEEIDARGPHAIRNAMRRTLSSIDKLRDSSMAVSDERKQRAMLIELLRSASPEHEIYRRISGEAEARNAEARRSMTKDERINKDPRYTEDVSRSEQLVRLNAPNQILSKWLVEMEGEYKLKLQICESVDQLPLAAKIELMATGKVAQAAIVGDQAYIVSSELNVDLAEAVAHEAAHRAVRSVFGRSMSKSYDRFYVGIGGDAGLQEEAGKAGFTLQPYFDAAKRMMEVGAIKIGGRTEMLVDEFVAHAVQERINERLTEKAVRLTKEFIGGLRNIFRRAGMIKHSELSATDMAYVLKCVHDAARGRAVTTPIVVSADSPAVDIANRKRMIKALEIVTGATASYAIELTMGAPTAEYPVTAAVVTANRLGTGVTIESVAGAIDAIYGDVKTVSERAAEAYSMVLERVSHAISEDEDNIVTALNSMEMVLEELAREYGVPLGIGVSVPSEKLSKPNNGHELTGPGL